MGQNQLFTLKYCYCFYILKWFRVLLSNTYKSLWYWSFVWTQWNRYKYYFFIEHFSLICAQLNDSKYFYVILILLIRLLTVKCFQVLLYITTNNSIKHQSNTVKWSNSSISNNATWHGLNFFFDFSICS